MKKAIAFSFLAINSFRLTAQDNFVLGTAGCPAIHCTAHEDDTSAAIPPLDSIVFIYHDNDAVTSGNSVATTSNGTYAAVKYQSGLMKVYDGAGNIFYTTGADFSAGTCPAIMGSDGGIISADRTHIARYPPVAGTPIPLWSTALPYSGIKSINNAKGTYNCGSLKLTPNGQVTVMSKKGPLATFDSTTGALLGAPLWPGGSPDTSFFAGNNSGCSDGNRIYEVGTRWDGPLQGTEGVLLGIDVSSSGLSVGAISETFVGPSNSSPMCAVVSGHTVVYTDVDSISGGSHNPGAIAFEDDGTVFSKLWTRSSSSMDGGSNRKIDSNFALDSVGFGGQPCAWVYVSGVSNLYCLDVVTGATLSAIATGPGFIPSTTVL